MRDIMPCAGEKVVDTENLVASFEKPLAKVRAQKARAPSDKNALPYRGRHIVPPKRFGSQPQCNSSEARPERQIRRPRLADTAPRSVRLRPRPPLTMTSAYGSNSEERDAWSGRSSA